MNIPVAIGGLHPSTVSCLELLQEMDMPHARVLDVGCGSGVLGVFCAQRWRAQLTASDISPQAVEDTLALCAQFHVQAQVFRADMLDDARIRDGAPYGLIICNLLAEPITKAAQEMAALAAPDGKLLFSGILAWLAPNVEAAYAKLGWRVEKRLVKEQWHTLVLSQ